MRRAAKVDENQSEIVDALCRVGARVQLLHQVGGGCPDLLVAFRGDLTLLEIKNPKQDSSHRQLTPDQVAFHAKWRTHCNRLAVVESIEQALIAIGAK